MSTRSPWMKRFFLDCEFTDFAHRDLISLAIVSEEADEFYVELTDFTEKHCSDFVRATVLPQLGHYPERRMNRSLAASKLSTWLADFALKPRPVLCFDYAGDLELLEALAGALPKGWKTQFSGLRVDLAKTEAWFQAHGGRHHALMDARAKVASFV